MSEQAVGWRDQPGGNELWALILEAFGRAADRSTPSAPATAAEDD